MKNLPMRMVKWGAARVFKEKTHLRTRHSHDLHSFCWLLLICVRASPLTVQMVGVKLGGKCHTSCPRFSIREVYRSPGCFHSCADSLNPLLSCLKYILYCSLGFVQWIPAHYWEVHTKETYNKAVQLTKGNSCVALFFILHIRFHFNQCGANYYIGATVLGFGHPLDDCFSTFLIITTILSMLPLRQDIKSFKVIILQLFVILFIHSYVQGTDRKWLILASVFTPGKTRDDKAGVIFLRKLIQSFVMFIKIGAQEGWLNWVQKSALLHFKWFRFALLYFSIVTLHKG